MYSFSRSQYAKLYRICEDVLMDASSIIEGKLARMHNIVLCAKWFCQKVVIAQFLIPFLNCNDLVIILR